MMMGRSLNLAVLAAVLVLFGITAQPAVAGEQKAVLITGASTGIGRNMAERLAKEGHFVYAGARKDKDLAELDAIENVKAVRLDVTKQGDVDAAVALISEEGRGLWGLVNNAGVASSGPIAMMDDDDLDFVLNVNVNGVVRVTRAFIPLIKESKGRITTTGSISGILSGANGSAYSMSKHAMEAFVDSLAAEMEEAGVHVSIIEPGSYKSMIRRTTVARIRKNIEATGAEIPEEVQEQMQQRVESELTMPEPDAVSDAALHTLFSDEPKRRYLVVPNERQADITIRKIISEMVQLNEGHEFSYSRDQLVEMLDQALNPQPASD